MNIQQLAKKNLRQHFPNDKVITRVFIKTLLGVLVGSFAFCGFGLILVTIDFFFDQVDSFNDLLLTLWSTVVITISWSLVFTIAPAILCGYILTFFIYQDFKKEKSTKRKSMIVGAKIIGLLGLCISLFVAFTIFRPDDAILALPYTIPVTIIASCIGAWGGLQVYKEILNFQENQL